MVARKTARAKSAPKLKGVSVGYFGGEIKTILISGVPVSEVFAKADITLKRDEEVLNSSGEKVKATEQAVQGETYYLTTKYVSQ